MYYFFSPDPGRNFDNVMIVGILYDSQGEIVGPIFNPGDELKPTIGEEKFTIVVDEKESTKGAWADTFKHYFRDAGSVFIGSDKVCSILKGMNISNVEFFDVEIKTKKEAINNYKIINVIRKINCIDYEKSELTTRKNGSVKYFNRLILDEKLIPGDTKIFLLGPNKTARVVLHESIKNAFQNQLDGFTFELANGYSGK